MHNLQCSWQSQPGGMAWQTVKGTTPVHSGWGSPKPGHRPDLLSWDSQVSGFPLIK